MTSIGLLIFDLDGTLVNTLDDIATSVNHTLECLGESPVALEAVRRYVGDGIEMLMQRSLRGKKGRLAEAVSMYKDHHRRNLVVRSSLYPTVKETLEYYRTLPMAVITNKTMEFSKPLLDRLGIGHYFKLVIGADHGLPLKPAPDSVLKIMTEFNVPKERTVIVGDGTTDVRAGKAAGIITCSVTYGFRPEEELRKEGPDYIISVLSDLRKIFAPAT
ncbi:MAG TPA: HAD-IA family hydrolase [Nitrospirota bacterium]|nr:HAD-IA family hydrolase [Nitrospirota bacterium]